VIQVLHLFRLISVRSELLKIFVPPIAQLLRDSIHPQNQKHLPFGSPRQYCLAMRTQSGNNPWRTFISGYHLRNSYRLFKA
jgi:hypothetical protein